MGGDRVVCLTRRRHAEPPSRDAAYLFGRKEDRDRAGAYLASKMLVPGADEVGFSAAVEAELNAMDHRDRVWLEIEMTAGAESSHSFDYDPSPWRP